ncbi:MAG: hypothetical protein MK041_03010 [Aquabacterium sp.]|nr:hypothetical protein [Aquabacterium sp.]
MNIRFSPAIAESVSAPLVQYRRAALISQGPVDQQIRHVTAFVLAQMDAMPDLMKPPMRLLQLLYCAHAWLRHAKPLASLPLDERVRLLQSWRRRAPFSDFVRFHEALAVYCLAEAGAQA